MPIHKCSSSSKPGYKWGKEGKCYTYTPGNESSRKAAKKKAIQQGVAIEGPEKFAQKAHQISVQADEYNDIMQGIADQLNTNDELNMTDKISYYINIGKNVTLI